MTTFLCITLALWLVLGTWFIGRKTPGYCQWRHTISELGAAGEAHELAARLALFLPVSLLAAVICLLFFRHNNTAAAALAACMALGYLSASLFPVDKGAPLHGSRANFWHNIGGMIMYLGGGVSLIAAHQQAAGYTMAGLLSLIGLAGLSPITPASYRGRLQRVIEALFLASLLTHSLS